MSKQTKLQSTKLSTVPAANASSASESPPTSEVPPPAMDTAALIHEVTQSLSSVIDEKLSKISETLERISSALEGQSRRIAETEQRVLDVEDTVAGLEARLAEAEGKIKAMNDSVDDMENRSRRENIRILNPEEGTEGRRPIRFFESWLPNILSLESTPGIKSCIKIDRAHRSLGPRGSRPRPIIIKLHNSRDKLRIMTAMRAKPNLEYEGKRFSISQDLSMVVRERRRAFNNVCRILIDKGIRFNMHFPATLIVHHDDAEHKFNTQGAAEAFLNTLE
ncbi:uncharacterized protein LOC121644778 [Melanotaenia boesemani]|uniref:uncharacterized protein LOC121644778 n=1 Tax=Melanotaenia boesemani TaxID=1250792 RepID=UPI001C04BE38|nr:uncharacterized protein LOC121644778 [Melanotaenia boesemani]